MARQVVTKNVDRISDLPDCLLTRILSFLPIKEAVGTSVLSPRWRYLFTSLPNLEFISWEFREHSTLMSFMCFVDRMLLYHKISVDTFRLFYDTRVDYSRVCDWISGAVSRGLRHLHLSLPLGQIINLPGVLLTCRTLVTLKLEAVNYFFLGFPEIVCLPNLKTLHLMLVWFFDDDLLKSFLSSCGSLEDMFLEHCSMRKNFNISHHLLKRLTILNNNKSQFCRLTVDTPNLAYFKYIGPGLLSFSGDIQQSLVDAHIDIIQSNVLQPDTTALFRAISKVRFLILSPSSLELLVSCEPLPVFATMVELKITGLKIAGPSWSVSRCQYWGKRLQTLLSCSPELEKLEFNEQLLNSLPEEVPPCLSFKLKVIEIWDFMDDKDCIEKVKYILKNGGALEKLIIHTGSYNYKEQKSVIDAVLLASPRKSKRCCIVIV